MNEGGSDSDSDSDSDFGFDSNTDDPGSNFEESTVEKRRDESDQEWGRIPIDADEHESEGGLSDGFEDEADPTEADDLPGPEPSSTPIKPGNPTLENALFVVLGAIAMGLVLFRLVSLGIGG